MRVSFAGDVEEARTWLGKAQQEIFRLQQRMTTQGQQQGEFCMWFSPLVSCIGYILPNGIQAVRVSAIPVPVRPEEPIEVEEEQTIVYEFFTSEHVSDGNLSTPGFPGFVGGSAMRTKFSAVQEPVTTPLFSTTIVPYPGFGDVWSLRSTTALASPDSGFITWASWQNQKYFEHCWYPNNDGKSLVTSTQAQAPGLIHKCGWLSPYLAIPLARGGTFNSDIGLDARPTLYDSSGWHSAAPEPDRAWVYWRQAAMQTVSGRKFFICADNYGRFHVYPMVDWRSNDNIVPAGHFKTYTPPYPDWVTLSDLEQPRHWMREWQWRFNKDATKCVSVPFHSENMGFGKNIPNPPIMTYGAYPPDQFGGIPSDNLIMATKDTPGLVEFGISIAVTGAGEMDYDATFTLLQQNYFGDSHRYFFDVGYFMKDVEGIGIAEDALMTAEIECKCPPGHYVAEVMSTVDPSAVATYDQCGFYSDCVIRAGGVEQLRIHMQSPISVSYPSELSHSGTFIWTQGEYNSPCPTIIAGDAAHGFPPEEEGTPFHNQFYWTWLYVWGEDFLPQGPESPSMVVGDYESGLWALDLKSMSVFYTEVDRFGGKAVTRGLAFGKEFYNLTEDIAINIYAPSHALRAMATETIPSPRPYQYVMYAAFLGLKYGVGFNTHPGGSWSFSCPGNITSLFILERDLPIAAEITNWHDVTYYSRLPIAISPNSWEWVCPKLKNKTKVYRHKNIYNGSFRQPPRDDSFYNTDTFSGKGLTDYGSFRTFGIWVDW